MTGRGYKSIQELRHSVQRQRQQEMDRSVVRPGSALRVRATMEASADNRVLHACRSAVLSWFADDLGLSFPRRAWRHHDFSHAAESSTCRAAHLRTPDRDLWVLQVERTPGPRQRVLVEVAVGREPAAAPFVTLSVEDRSVAPVELDLYYPGGMLAALSEETELQLADRPLIARPIVVDSVRMMHVFLQMLIDPERERRTFPLVVASAATHGDPSSAEIRRWENLARLHAGLAETWVLPQARTYELSDTVGKSHSVFLGAWRFYRAGFSSASERSDHPLVLARRMPGDDEADAIARRFLRYAVQERLRMAGDAPDWPRYDAVAAEAGQAVRGPGRFIRILRSAFAWGGRARPPGTPAVAAVGEAVVQSDAGVANGSPGPPLTGTPRVAESELRLRTRLQETEKRLRDVERRVQSDDRQYRDVQQRAEEAERARAEAEAERERAVRRVARLEGMVRSMGGNADAEIPFPIVWSDFVAWSDENLEGRVELTGSARREIDAAAYEDVGLVARCLLWLADEYREARIGGNNPNLMGRIDAIDEGVFNRPCGGDSFDCVWNGRSWRVDWHIKSGANTRDPRRCLRIYYFWDDESRKVVIASMPAHRRSALS